VRQWWAAATLKVPYGWAAATLKAPYGWAEEPNADVIDTANRVKNIK
jgi:hypothetical protein